MRAHPACGSLAGTMNQDDLARRLRVLWYRIAHGMTPTQAEFRVARDADRAARPAPEAERRHFHCVCGQLLVGGDRTCHACGRRQYLPYPVRQAARALRDLLPAEHPGAVFVLGLIVLGYALQWRAGGGASIMRPAGLLEDLDLGASVPSLTLGPQPWRAVTYAFLHGGLMHLVMNLVTLAQIGPLIEGHFGSGRFLLGWVVTGAAGVLLPPLVTGPQVGVTLGASGAICGLIGMAWIAARQLQTAQGREVKRAMERWMIYTTVMGLALEFGAGVRVAHGAHFGGALAGVALGWLVPPPTTPGRRRASFFVGLAGFALLAAGLGALVAWQFDGRPIPATRDAFGASWEMAREMAVRRDR